MVNKRGQSLGMSWWVWLILLIFALVLIGLFMVNRFGWLESQAGQVPQSLSTREGICITLVKERKIPQTEYCSFRKIESGDYVNCEDRRIQVGMKKAGIKSSVLIYLACEGQAEILYARDVCRQEKETDWDDIKVGEKKCDAWCANGACT
jgi:hypothetical protein